MSFGVVRPLDGFVDDGVWLKANQSVPNPGWNIGGINRALGRDDHFFSHPAPIVKLKDGGLALKADKDFHLVWSLMFVRGHVAFWLKALNDPLKAFLIAMEAEVTAVARRSLSLLD